MIRGSIAVAAGYTAIAVVTMTVWVTWPQAPRQLPMIGLLILSLLVGLVASCVGGAVTAAMARGAEVRAAAALALVVVLFELAAMPFTPRANPAWYDALALLTSAGGVMVGGVAWVWAAAHRRARRVVRLYKGLFSGGRVNGAAGRASEREGKWRG